MTTLQSDQRIGGSPASSYAETDSDSDSDNNDDYQCRLDAKRRHVAKDSQRVWTRTAPIFIPASSHQTYPHLCESVEESPDLSYHADMRLLRAGRYLHDSDDDELDEDDPAFYGNLAFFRSQYGETPSRLLKRSVNLSKVAMAPTSPTAVDDNNEGIFAMELQSEMRPFSAKRKRATTAGGTRTSPKPQFAIVKAPLTPKHQRPFGLFNAFNPRRSSPTMPPAQTQSLPTWTSNLNTTLPLNCKQTFEEDPAYLSGEDTDCESERGSDVLSREDQQLMANLMCLQKERARKHHQFHLPCPAVARATPVMIPTQSRRYEETASKNWVWDEDDEDCDQCPCCQDRSESRPATRPVEKVEPPTVANVSDLMFDLEL
ncbi:hypothetical protein BBO99_00001573 [Phytophthora kernoviae]|uniref:Uncharacterized protein n=2 Tax=Phytophthora kernoviae TaxID=325452 RepID=A0A3R7MUC5_9STRA|nr:hypothetical protein G195_006838 [Phytophthora kernoviae 00238/432]RLN38061.1 hypothetical protein BBI17_001791 [Phytophthora kernoviae]RLN84119.1 hypothetical protein BBO99_00001573 [Phytophthora kernoviae]